MMTWQHFIKGCLVVVWLGAYVAVATLRSQPPAPQLTNGGYLESGNSSCAGCHQNIAESYARTGMARSFGVVRAGTPFPELTGGSFHHLASEEFFNVYTQDGRPYLKRHQVGSDGSVINTLSAPIDYWFGSGKHARSYLSRTKSGELVELPITWYAANGGYWAMSPGYDRPDHAGFSRAITARCMFCHNGYPGVATGVDTLAGALRFQGPLPEGIDCQRCHGPGQAHVNAARQKLSPDRVRSSIVNPARLAPERQMEVCMQCHLETTSLRLPANLLRYDRGVFSYRPGEPLENYLLHFDRAPGSGFEERFEFDSSAYRLRKSPCFVESRGALTCTTCHNPHEPSNSPAAISRYTAACQKCHQSAVEKLVAARRHPASQDCTTCHMPKRRPADAIHVMVTDHDIRKRPAGDPPGPLVEQHDANTPPYRGRVVPYYPSQLARTPEADLYLAVAQVKHQTNPDEGLRRLEEAITQHAPARSEFYFELAEAYRNSGRLDRAIAMYEQAGARAPVDWRHFYRLGTAFSSAGKLAQAASALERARALAPQEPAVLEAIADLLAKRGKLPEAVTTLQAALALEPESARLHSNLGARWFLLGDMTGAEKSWREAVRLRPEAATMRLNLANLLASRGHFPEAQDHFKAALRSDRSFAEARLAYALALETQRDLRGAREQYEAALQLDPRLLVAHLNLANVLLQMGDRTGAIRASRQALALRPDSAPAHYQLGLALVAAGIVPEAEQHFREAIRDDPHHFAAHLKLGQILFARNEAALARPHLRQAAQSPDPQVRTAANLLLAPK